MPWQRKLEGWNQVGLLARTLAHGISGKDAESVFLPGDSELPESMFQNAWADAVAARHLTQSHKSHKVTSATSCWSNYKSQPRFKGSRITLHLPMGEVATHLQPL